MLNYLFLALVLLPLGFCGPVSNDVFQGRRIGFEPFNISAPTRSLSLPSNTTTKASTTFLPHRFRVPDTETVLRLGFGIRRRRVDREELRTLLRFSLAFLEEGKARYGGDTIYQQQLGPYQRYEQLGFGIELVVQDIRESAEVFTWRELYEAVEGLMLYLVEGNRCWETTFLFFNHAGRFPDLNSEAVGWGVIRRPINPRSTMRDHEALQG